MVDEELLELLKWKFVNFCLVRFPGRRHSDRSWFCSESAVKATRKWEAKILELAGFLDSYIPEPERAIDKRIHCCRSNVFSSPVVVPLLPVV